MAYSRSPFPQTASRKHCAGYPVYPYVVPLLDGRPSVALPWVVFSLISSVS
ncbi:hypothetical protein LZ625_25995, partial [Escherichia coli]|nr:hypothetical protein [Escherichia coli]